MRIKHYREGIGIFSEVVVFEDSIVFIMCIFEFEMMVMKYDSVDFRYLEVKFWFVFQHENVTTGNKMLWKRGEIAAIPSIFHNTPICHNIINSSITSEVKLHMHL